MNIIKKHKVVFNFRDAEKQDGTDDVVRRIYEEIDNIVSKVKAWEFLDNITIDFVKDERRHETK